MVSLLLPVLQEAEPVRAGSCLSYVGRRLRDEARTAPEGSAGALRWSPSFLSTPHPDDDTPLCLGPGFGVERFGDCGQKVGRAIPGS
jgi:hypothetical protein